MGSRVAIGLVLAVLMLALAAPVQASNGRIPIYAPGAITSSGKFILTRDIAGTGSAPAIDVQALEVDIDLNGFTVTNAGGVDAIYVFLPQARLTVRNGTLANCHSGVYAGAAGLVVLEDLKIRDTWGGGVVLLDVPSITIRRVVGTALGSDGIGVYGPVAHNAEITDCSVHMASSNGIVFNNGTPIIRNNRVTRSAVDGMWVNGARGGVISGNAIDEAGGTAGLHLVSSYGNVVEGNAVRAGTIHGIRVTQDSWNNQIRNNVASMNGIGSSGHGLLVEGSMNQIEQNTLNGNESAGLYFGFTGCGNTFGRNTARNNAGTGVPAVCPDLFPPNSCSNCTSDANSSFGDNLIPVLF